MVRYKQQLYLSDAFGLYRLANNSWDTVSYSHRSGVVGGAAGLYQDKLVIAGLFDSIGHQQIKRAAFFDGANWFPLYNLDTVLDGGGGITCALEYKGQLYAAGNIDNQSHPEFQEIVRFDGHRWRDVGGGIRSGGLAGVYKMLIWRNELYVAGQFSEGGGGPGNGIAKWDGQHWHRLGDGLTQIDPGTMPT